MRIEELQPDQKISLLVNANGTPMVFESKVQDVYAKKHFVLIDAVYYEEKALSFRGKSVVVNMLVHPENEPPRLFKNVSSTLLKKNDGTFCYCIRTIAESVAYNRRDTFRCYVGLPSSIQCGPNNAAHEIIIRDISASGYSIVCDSRIALDLNHLIHVVLNDTVETPGREQYIFHLYGLVKRIEELENGSILYGCKLNNYVNGLEKYLMLKERLRLKRAGGRDLF